MPPWSGGGASRVGDGGSRGGMHAPVTGRRAVNRLLRSAIETGLALRLSPSALRQTEGALRSIADLLGLEIRIPDIRLSAGVAAA